MTEANYWRQRYEMLMENFGDALKAAGLPPPPTVLADKESFEAGRFAEREACAQLCERMARRTNDIRRAALEVAAENIRARGQDPMPLFDDWGGIPYKSCPPCNHDCNQGRDCPNA